MLWRDATVSWRTLECRRYIALYGVLPVWPLGRRTASGFDAGRHREGRKLTTCSGIWSALSNMSINGAIHAWVLRSGESS